MQQNFEVNSYVLILTTTKLGSSAATKDTDSIWWGEKKAGMVRAQLKMIVWYEQILCTQIYAYKN